MHAALRDARIGVANHGPARGPREREERYEHFEARDAPVGRAGHQGSRPRGRHARAAAGDYQKLPRLAGSSPIGPGHPSGSRPFFLPPIHPSAWKGRSPKVVCDISYNAVAVGEKRACDCRETRGPSQHLESVHKDSPCRVSQVLTPLLTPLSAQYAVTAGNREQRNRLR